ncbi:MAG TPA: hypothetical protein VGJ30_11860 [Candidatus Angelobacter sp.]
MQLLLGPPREDDSGLCANTIGAGAGSSSGMERQAGVAVECRTDNQRRSGESRVIAEIGNQGKVTADQCGFIADQRDAGG